MDHIERGKLFDQVWRLSPEEKVLLFEHLGMRRSRHAHRYDCQSLNRPHLICTCQLAPASTWTSPSDVCGHLGEDRGTRQDYIEQRVAHELGDGEAPKRWEIY